MILNFIDHNYTLCLSININLLYNKNEIWLNYIYIKLHMNLKNSIESIEIYNLGIFSSMLSNKYKFIPVSDIMNIWNLNFTNKKPDTCFPIFQNKTSSTKNNLSKKPPVKKNSGCLKPRLKIKDEDCVLKPRLKINDENCVLKPRLKINDGDCVLKPRLKINDEDCVLKPRMKINDEDYVLKPRMKIKDEECVIQPVKVKDEECGLKIMEITTEEKNEKPEEDEDTTIDDEIIGSIIKKMLFNEDTVSIPTYLTNYLNSNKIAMNVEKIIEYEDIEDILQDINF